MPTKGGSYMFESLKKFFTPAESLDPNKAKAFLAEREEGSYTLLDVRQPSEYEEEHLPGAKLIPITQLSDKMNELDPEKPVLVY
jgi:rhodanese-related sulfurtransferase